MCITITRSQIKMGSTFRLPNKNELKKEYERSQPLYKRLVQEVCFILWQEIEKTQVKIHGLKRRIKSFDSFYDKILRKEISGNPFEKVWDIAGVRIICLYRSDLKRLGKLVYDNFDVLTADTERTRRETSFGYIADHYIVKLKQEVKGKRYDDIKSLPCEIQVRTILMDAWASVSHHLDYKKEIDIPSELRKDFNAVSGLLYAADTHFEIFKERIEEAREKLEQSLKQRELDIHQEINLDTLETYLRWKLPYRERARYAYSDLITELRDFGFRKLDQLDDFIESSKEAAQELETEEISERFYADTGFVRICLMLFDDEYRKSMEILHGERNKKLFELLKRHRLKAKKQSVKENQCKHKSHPSKRQH